MSLSLGAVYGGPEHDKTSPSAARITRLMKRMAELQGDSAVGTGTGGSLNVVFHVPGSLIKPDYMGVRTAKFSRKNKMLMVQVAIPDELLRSPNLEGFLVASIREAVCLARPVFDKARIGFCVEEHLALVDRAEASLVH